MNKAASTVIVIAGIFCLVHYLIPMYNQFINNSQCPPGYRYYHGHCI